MTRFSPESWKKAGKDLLAAAEDFYASAEPVIVSRVLTATTACPIEEAGAKGDEIPFVAWHHLIGNFAESMSATASKMVATGESYSAAEEEAATKRFWEEK